MRKHFIGLSLVTLAILFIATSCGKKQQLTVTKDQLSYNSSGGVDIFQVVANCEWTLETSSDDWFYIGQTLVSHDTTTVSVFAKQNTSEVGRNGWINITSENKKITKVIQVCQEKPKYSAVVDKVWFTRTHERWNTDYQGDSIPYSYRSWTYYTDPRSTNWLWYFFEDAESYLIFTQNRDTVFYPFEYKIFPEDDRFDVRFITVDTTVENYHAIINQLDDDFFIFTNEYRPNQFEKNSLTNVTGNSRGGIKINPNKVKYKPAGRMIPFQ